MWRFYIANPTAAGCILDFKLICDALDGDPSKRRSYQTQIKPGADGYVNVYMQDIIDSMIDYELPVISGDTIQPAANIRLVNIQFREITDADPDPAWITTESAFTRYIIKGGIELLKHDHNNYFINYHATNKPFATWMPVNCFVSIDQQFYTSFLLTNIAIPNWKLRVVAEWSDNTNDVIDIVVTDHTKIMYHVKAGAEDLGINSIAAGRQLWRYSLQVRDAADPTISYTSAFTFYADYRNFYKVKLFNYFNSLGGIDHARILGEQEDDYVRNFTESELFTGSITPGDPPLTQYAQTNATRLNTYKSDAGLRHMPTQMMALQELFTSAFVWEILNTKNRQLWILNKNGALKKKTDKKWPFPIEWRYGFTEQVYTPIEIDLGVGSDATSYPGSACPIPAGITVVDLGGGSIQFNWTYSSAASNYILEYKLTTDSSWTTYPSHIGPGDLPLTIAITVGLDYDYRVKAICDDVDHPESPWVYGVFIGI